MKPYADTNFYTRVYLRLPDSERADNLIEEAKICGAELLPITWLHQIELANALELSVWLGKQGGQPRVSSRNAAVALSLFKDDLKSEEFLCAAPIDLSALQATAEEIVSRYTAKYGFRTYDILHVAAARLLGCDHFYSFDFKAVKLAQLEGLKVIN